MPTKIGYIGNPTSTMLWDQQQQIVTVISNASGNGYASMNSTWPVNITQVLKMDLDEYPTAINFTGYARNRGWTEALTLGLSDSNGNNYHQLNSVTMSGPDEYGDLYLNMSQYNGSGTWTDLAGATLALKKTSTYKLYRLETTVITVTTAYFNRTITTGVSGAGTINITNNSLSRGQTATITVTPSSGYAIRRVEATHGTISRNNATSFTYTMSTPAQNTSIIAYFVPIALSAQQGNIIYADWYNQ